MTFQPYKSTYTLERLPPRIRYVAWLDHDIVIADNHWLNNAIALLDAGHVVAQLFKSMSLLDINQHVTGNKRSTLSGGVCPEWCLDRAPRLS